MILNERILSKPIIEEVSTEELPEGVLSRVSYLICNIGKRNANNRVYERAVWDKVFGKDLQEQMIRRALFGHAEHPDQTQSNLEKTSHVIFEMKIDDKEVWQRMDILDTPGGRIVDTLIRAGCQVGVSTRAEGDLEEAEDDTGSYQRVIPESYNYVTTDFTADPSTFGTVPVDVKRNIVSEVSKELQDKKLNGSERQFAQLILESMNCQGSECVVEGAKKIAKRMKEIKEGVWALPNTVAKAKKLAELMKEPLSSEVAVENLYDVLGDDELWDDFKYKGGTPRIDDDVRPLVKKRVRQYLKDYKEDPKGFKQKLDPEAEKILKGLVVEQKTIESLVRDKLIKIGTELKYGNKDAKVEKIEEGKVSISMPGADSSGGKIIDIDGAAYVTIQPDNSIIIQPDREPPLPTPAPDEIPEEPPRVVPDSADAIVVSDDEIPEGKKQFGKESIVVGDIVKIEEGEYKGREGKVTKVDEGSIGIILDTGVAVQIEDSTSISITIAPPPVEVPEEEIEAMEAAGPLPIEKDIPERKVVMGTEEEKFDDESESGWSTLKDISGLSNDDLMNYIDYWEKAVMSGDSLNVDQAKANQTRARKELRVRGITQATESKVDEAKVVQKDDGWYVVSPAGKDLGGPYPSEGAANLRKKDVEFYAASRESKLTETEDIKAMYKAAKLPTPDGKGIHTEAFHELAIKIAKGYVESGDSPEEALDKAYPTAMKQLGKEKAVKKAHQSSEAKVEEAVRVGDKIKFSKFSYPNTAGGTGSGDTHPISDLDTYFDGVATGVVVKEWDDYEIGQVIHVELDDKTWDLIKDKAKKNIAYISEFDLVEFKVDEVDKEFNLGDKFEYKGKEYKLVYQDIQQKYVDAPPSIVGIDGEDSEGNEVHIDSDDFGKVRVKESISTTVKEIKDLQVKEASIRAERDKAIELLEELTNENQQLQEKARKEKILEVKILINKMSKVLEDKEQEINALISKLEEKVKIAADLKEQLEEKVKLVSKVDERLNRVKTNLSNNVKSLKKSAIVTNDKHEKTLLEVKENHQKKLNETVKLLEEKIEISNKETEKKVKEEVTKEVTKEFVKSFIEYRLSETGLKVDDNSRALLENCKSLEEVDDLLDEVVDASRRSALHSESITGIHVAKQVVVDPEEEKARRQVNNVFEGMG